MKNKKAFLMGETGIKLIVAVLVSLILVALGAALYSSFIKDTAKDKASLEADSIYSELQKLNPISNPLSYTAIYAPEWFLTSSTQDNLCGEANFCLCICKTETCKQSGDEEIEVACTPTGKFISIRKNFDDGTTKEVKYTKLQEAPSKLILSYVNEKVYPKTESKKENRNNEDIVPIFYQFQEKEWKWTLDLTNWMDTTGTEVTAGEFKPYGWAFFRTADELYYSDNIAIIKILNKNKNNKEDGKNLLESVTAESNGVYRIDV